MLFRRRGWKLVESNLNNQVNLSVHNNNNIIYAMIVIIKCYSVNQLLTYPAKMVEACCYRSNTGDDGMVKAREVRFKNFFFHRNVVKIFNFL